MNRDCASVGNGIDSIAEKSQEQSLEKASIGQDLVILDAVYVEGKTDTSRIERRRQKTDHRREAGGDRLWLLSGGGPPTELEQPTDELLAVEDVALQSFEVGPGRGLLGALPHHLHAQQHGGQGCIEVVRGPGRHLAHARELLDLQEPLPQAHALPDVRRDLEKEVEARCFAERQQAQLYLETHSPAVTAPRFHLDDRCVRLAPPVKSAAELIPPGPLGVRPGAD